MTAQLITLLVPTRRSSDLVDEEELGLDLPEDISLVGNAKGNRSNLAVNAELITSQGNAIAKGHWINEKGIDFSADVDRKSTRLNSSHVAISYAVFCLKNKT